MSLVDDWIAFCEGKLKVDKSDFLTLFHAEYDDETLEKIFGFFPASAILKERMQRFMAARRLRFENRIAKVPPIALLQLAESDLRSKVPIFESVGDEELLQIAKHATAVIIDNRLTFDAAARSDWPNGEKQVVVSDFVLDHWLIQDDKAFALFEAFYGAANSYDIQYYLAAPLIDAAVNFNPYFELWSAGTDVALTQENILVFRDHRLLALS